MEEYLIRLRYRTHIGNVLHEVNKRAYKYNDEKGDYYLIARDIVSAGDEIFDDETIDYMAALVKKEMNLSDECWEHINKMITWAKGFNKTYDKKLKKVFEDIKKDCETSSAELQFDTCLPVCETIKRRAHFIFSAL